MDISYQQLQHYLKTKISLDETVNYLTQMGVEVESINRSNPNTIILSLEITPNRPDLMSYLGLARELAGALRQKDLVVYPESFQIEKNATIVNETIDNHLAEKNDCPVYYLREIHNIQIKPSPDFIQAALSATGIGVKNNVIDIINFVMLETGQPMHACDQAKLRFPLQIKTLPNKTPFTTLDGIKREISDQDIVIADADNQPLALGGVMGSQHAEISASTQSIYIECAYFNPITIRKTCKRLGLMTDSARRFELGVDPDNSLAALARATELLLAYTGGTLGKTYTYGHPHPKFDNKITFDTDLVERHLGLAIDLGFCEQALNALGFTVEKNKPTQWTVAIPSARRYDIKRPICLVEEIAKVYDYNRIPNQFPQTVFSVRQEAPWLKLKKQSEYFFTQRGFHQAINFSFTSPAEFLQFELKAEDPYCQFVEIERPLNQDLSILRTSLIPSLVKNFTYNRDYQISEQSLFEIGKRFWLSDNQPQDEDCLAGLCTGPSRLASWKDHAPWVDFHDMKALLWGFFNSLGLERSALTARSSHLAFFMPDEQASLYYRENCIGHLGRLNTKILSKKIKEPIYVFEVSLSKLETLNQLERSHYQAPSKYPSILRDLSVICPIAYPSEKIIQIIEKYAGKLVKQIQLSDVYRGKPIAEGHESLSYKIEFNVPDRTLSNEELNPVMDAIIEALHQADLKLRS